MIALTVVIPTYNRSDSVGAAVTSALAQDCRQPYEVVVVDDGSSDNTRDVLAGFGDRIRIIRQPNRGRSAASNAGVAHARADIVAFLHSDDLWLAGKVRLTLERFASCPAAGLVYSDHYDIDRDGRVLGERRFRSGFSYAEMFTALEWVGPPSNIAVRKATFQSVGGFDESLYWGEDIEFFLRMRRATQFAHVPEPLMCYRKRVDVKDSVRAYPAAQRRRFEHVMRKQFGADATTIIGITRDQKASGLLWLALDARRRRRWLEALCWFAELAWYRPMYLPRQVFGALGK